jgi:hypothetical protein
MLSLCSVIFVLGIFVKFVFPKLLAIYNKKLDMERERLAAEKNVIEATLVRWTESQEKINTVIATQFNSLNDSMSEIREVIKASLKIMFIVSLASFLSCDSDMITVYKFKSKEVLVEKQLQVSDEPKSCNPPCSPPKTSCNSKTGKCEGAAAVKEAGNLPTSDLLFYVQKFGWPQNSTLWR